jgi:hypothetical protein
MIGKDDEKKTVKKHSVWVCPNCGKTVHYSRLYCVCRCNLSRAASMMAEEPPEIGRCNLETSGLSCDDCPENCAWCAGFGESSTNKQGFGGQDCRHHGETSKCYCCQAQVKIGLEIGGNSISGIIGNATSERLRTMADVIREKTEKLVLARIHRAKGMAG